MPRSENEFSEWRHLVGPTLLTFTGHRKHKVSKQEVVFLQQALASLPIHFFRAWSMENEFELANQSCQKTEVQLSVYLRHSLMKLREFDSHPPFSTVLASHSPLLIPYSVTFQFVPCVHSSDIPKCADVCETLPCSPAWVVSYFLRTMTLISSLSRR